MAVATRNSKEAVDIGRHPTETRPFAACTKSRPMPLYLPTHTMEPCTLSDAARGSVFVPFGQAPLLVGEVDQHDIAVKLGGDHPFTTIAFSRDERSSVRGLVIGEALFDGDPESAYRVKDANCAGGDIILGKSSTSIVGVHEDGSEFEVTILGDPTRGAEAGFSAWRLGVQGRDGAFVAVFERVPSAKHKAANSNG